MEMVFRRLEYRHRRLGGAAAAPQSRSVDRGTTAAQRSSSRRVFLALSFVIANVFLAWVIGAPALSGADRRHAARGIPAGFTAMVIFTSVFYLVFARFREQACVLACPYGRMMSSLVDRRTVTVTYDCAARRAARAPELLAALGHRPATASTAIAASRSVRPASTSATAFSSSASAAPPASTRATTSCRGSGGPPA